MRGVWQRVLAIVKQGRCGKELAEAELRKVGKRSKHSEDWLTAKAGIEKKSIK